ncbi:nose resistant to fluoxetine protein 6-like [Chelonus insularis]|uniref:nose resistant to fluoxetine protein 6-like n=1 Tax=Chelonus insularis TaxID=460826 RepID=UPI00158D2FA6|nr:nose resistant to fluoxetine protein 6-like [Chelonus insularis]
MLISVIILVILSLEKSFCDTFNVFHVNSSEISQLINTREVSSDKPDLSFIQNNSKVHFEFLLEGIEDQECRDQVKLVIFGLKNFTKWAFEFYDASAKIPDGILSGSIYQLGNFDECVKVEDESVIGFSRKYCLSEVTLEKRGNHSDGSGVSVWDEFNSRPGNDREKSHRDSDLIEKLFYGVCVPVSCDVGDVERVLDKIINHTLNVYGVDLKSRSLVDKEKCYKNQTINIDTYDIAYLACILIIIFLVFLGTVFHISTLSRPNQPQGLLFNILRAFSLISNIKKLCSHAHEDGLNLSCISGIKFAAMGFIVAGHCLMFVLGGPILNKDFWRQASGRVENAIFLNNPLLVDTFLFLSGFLFARIVLQELDKRKYINFFFLYVFRYIRLTPAYLVMIGLYTTWLPKLDSGPLWSRMTEEKRRCLDSWWTNLLYINNYVNTDNLCMFQSWYLSVDTQLFILAPAIIYPLWRWRKVGELILSSATALTVVVPFTVTLVNSLDPTLMIYIKEIQDISSNYYFKNFYIKTHMRASAYCFGLIFGYILYRIQTSNYKFSRLSVRIYWILASLSLVSSMFSITTFYTTRKNFTSLEAATYSALHRVFWSLGTGWVIIACITDNSGPVRNFLKWKPFIPLSRLTYCAYLVNGIVELYSISTTRTPQYLDNINLFSKVMGHLVMTFGGAVILSTFFEGPILGLERIFLRPVMEASKASKRDNQDGTDTTEA